MLLIIVLDESLQFEEVTGHPEKFAGYQSQFGSLQPQSGALIRDELQEFVPSGARNVWAFEPKQFVVDVAVQVHNVGFIVAVAGLYSTIFVELPDDSSTKVAKPQYNFEEL